jgi:hypothetical protein
MTKTFNDPELAVNPTWLLITLAVAIVACAAAVYWSFA